MIRAQTDDSTEPIESLTELTATDWIIAGAVFVGSIVVARLVASGLRRILGRTSLSEHGSTLLSRFVAYFIVVLGFIYALGTVSVPHRTAPWRPWGGGYRPGVRLSGHSREPNRRFWDAHPQTLETG